MTAAAEHLSETNAKSEIIYAIRKGQELLHLHGIRTDGDFLMKSQQHVFPMDMEKLKEQYFLLPGNPPKFVHKDAVVRLKSAEQLQGEFIKIDPKLITKDDLQHLARSAQLAQQQQNLQSQQAQQPFQQNVGYPHPAYYPNAGINPVQGLFDLLRAPFALARAAGSVARATSDKISERKTKSSSVSAEENIGVALGNLRRAEEVMESILNHSSIKENMAIIRSIHERSQNGTLSDADFDTLKKARLEITRALDSTTLLPMVQAFRDLVDKASKHAAKGLGLANAVRDDNPQLFVKTAERSSEIAERLKKLLGDAERIDTNSYLSEKYKLADPCQKGHKRLQDMLDKLSEAIERFLQRIKASMGIGASPSAQP